MMGFPKIQFDYVAGNSSVWQLISQSAGNILVTWLAPELYLPHGKYKTQYIMLQYASHI